jgi:dolichol-phosphate mannosyltransferase
VDQPRQKEMAKARKTQLSIVLPTYNESQNIVNMLDSIAETLPPDSITEIIVVDDNSPDGTADIASNHAKNNLDNRKLHIEVIRRDGKSGLSSAILTGVQSASGEIILAMDGDFSHPPQIIPYIVDALLG